VADDPKTRSGPSPEDVEPAASTPYAGWRARPIPRGPRPRLGVLDPRRVRMAAFGTIVLSLFGTAALCILSVWDYVHHDVGWRAIATFVIVIATMAAFTLVNEFFGASLPPSTSATRVS
jgi:hypothetical protein